MEKQNAVICIISELSLDDVIRFIGNEKNNTEENRICTIPEKEVNKNDGGANAKWGLTIEEAAKYFNIGENKLRELTDSPSCNFILRNGNRRIIKRELFEKFLNEELLI